MALSEVVRCEGRVLTNGVSAVIQETGSAPLPHLPSCEDREDPAVSCRFSLGTNSAGALTLDFSASRNKCLLLIAHPVCGPLLQKPELRQCVRVHVCVRECACVCVF